MQKTWVRIVTTVFTLGILIMIFCFSMEPAEQSDATSGRIAEKVADRVRPEWRNYEARKKKAYFQQVQHVVRKCAHYIEFAFLGLSLSLCLESWFGRRTRRGLPLGAWLGGTACAVLDEMHQRLVDGRSGQWTDVLLDSAGVASGALIGWVLIRLIRKKMA